MTNRCRDATSLPPSPADWDAETYDRIADPMTRWGAAMLGHLELDGDERVLDAGAGSGRVTELLCQRVPEGSVIALDLSAAMLAEAQRRLARFLGHVDFVRANLSRPLPILTVDAIFSSATFHWVHDHDALFANLAAVLRPGGQLVAQCGGVGNIERVHAAARAAGVDPQRTYFATPADTEGRLQAAGFVDTRCWLQPEPTTLESAEALNNYLRTVCLREHLQHIPTAQHDAFLSTVVCRLGAPVIDYVRLNIVARRA
jgi:trans-aconitate 2-methyltransferase